MAADMLIEQFGLHLRPSNEPLLHRGIMTATAVYVVLMAMPFMPAAEIGFSMLVIFGASISFLVYVSTVVALTLAYLVGRLLPAELAAKAFDLVGLARARDFVNRLAPLSADQRLALLVRDSPAPWAPSLIRHRYLALAVLLNLPGNIVIGGGGGIALLAGMTRLFPFPAYLLTVALAVAPVPLIVSLAAWV
ncbi:MAG: hypothetical protein ACREGK_08065 [Geminicoccales bacterium]